MDPDTTQAAHLVIKAFNKGVISRKEARAALGELFPTLAECYDESSI